MKKTKDQVQEEALKALEYKQRAGVAVSMGVGKTLIGLKHLNNRYINHGSSVKALVVAPKKSIWESWSDELVKHNMPWLSDSIEYTTYLSLCKKDLSKYDVIYLDECHNLLLNHTVCLSKFSGVIIGLTGTPPTYATSEKGKMVNTYCPMVYEYLVDDAIDDGILNDYEIVVHLIPLSTLKNVMVGSKLKKWPSSEVDSYYYWCDRIDKSLFAKETMMLRIQRMKAMMDYPSKEAYARKLFNSISDKCILFANTQVQADRLCRHSYHSENKDSDENLLKFKSGIIPKLSAVLQLSEGVNIPELKQGIIMHAYGNERKSSQRIGRMLRLNPTEKSVIHVLCYKNTVDEAWTKAALAAFDQSKIRYINV